jgi:cyclopropane fatty-acyl-phospholipid synthase-like methyltransferase
MKQDHEHHSPHHRFDDPSALATHLDAPERDVWQQPEAVIESFQLADDATVAEIGPATGYFAVRLARRLKHGTVIGLDAEPKMVAYLQQRAAELGLTNIDARLAHSDQAIDLHQPVDLLLCVDTYHHLTDRVVYFSTCRHQLKADGKLIIIDRAANAPEGPPAGHRIPSATVKEELTNAGFTCVAELDFLLPYQYYLAFRPTVLGNVPE